MVSANGRPFLAYLIQQLREQGIRRVLLLTGYRGEVIREAFANGAEVGVAIDYSHGPAEWETGRRIWEARAVLHPRFLLLYSDNYVPFCLDTLCAFHAQREAVVSLLVQQKARGNVRLAADGGVKLYDPTRAAAGLEYVEIGYMVVERDAMLGVMDDPAESFSRTLRKLAERRQLAAMITRDQYHSISDLERWRLAERYLASKRILLIDRDGTINRRPPPGEYIHGWGGFHWITETVAAMRELSTKGFQFIVLSNQAGIARGMIDADAVSDVNQRMLNKLRLVGIDILAVYVCPHHWDDGCECRKPAPGMFFRASSEHLLRLDRTMYVGDDPRDCQAASNANCLSLLVGPERHKMTGGAARPALAAETLLETVPWIIARFEEWESIP